MYTTHEDVELISTFLAALEGRHITSRCHRGKAYCTRAVGTTVSLLAGLSSWHRVTLTSWHREHRATVCMGNKQTTAIELEIDPNTGLTALENKELENAYKYGQEQTKKQRPRNLLGRSRTTDSDRRGLNRKAFRRALKKLAECKQRHLFKEIKKLKHQRQDFVNVISETLFDSFDVKNNKEISLNELKRGISVCLRGTAEDKMEWGFERLLNRRTKRGTRSGKDSGGGGGSSGSNNSSSSSSSNSNSNSSSSSRRKNQEYNNEDARRGRGNRKYNAKTARRRKRRQSHDQGNSSSDDHSEHGRESKEEGSDQGSDEGSDDEDKEEDEEEVVGKAPVGGGAPINLMVDTVNREDLRLEIQKSVAIQRRHQRFIETRALVSAQQLCETLNRQLSDARLSDLRIATSSHVEAILLKAEETIEEQVEHAMKLMDVDMDGKGVFCVSCSVCRVQCVVLSCFCSSGV